MTAPSPDDFSPRAAMEVLRRVLNMCVDRSGLTGDGHRTDVEGIWPSEIVAILKEEIARAKARGDMQ